MHFIIGRDGGETPDPRPRHAGAGGRRDRPHLERRARRDRLARDPGAGTGPGAVRALSATRSPTAIARPIPPEDALEDIQVIESLSAERPLGVEFYPRSEDGKPCVGLKVWSHGRPIPLSERVPVLENMGFRVVDERTFEVGGEDRGALAARHGAGARRWRARRPRNRKGALEGCFIMVMRGARRERRLQRAGDGGGCSGATWRWCAPSRASCGRSACLIRRITCGRRCASTRGLRRRSSSCSTRGSIRAAGRSPRQAARRRSPPQIEAALGGRREPRRGPHHPPFRQRGAVGDPHQLLSARQGRPARSRRSRSSSPAASSTACRGPRRFTRSSSIRRASRACICASARWRAAASAGRTGRRISAPRCWAW